MLPGSILYTDALRSYRQTDRDYVHHFIDHSLRFAEGRVHTNNIENFWSCVKRPLHGTYIAPRAFHLNAYLDESVFRFNNRELPDGARLEAAFRGHRGSSRDVRRSHRNTQTLALAPGPRCPRRGTSEAAPREPAHCVASPGFFFDCRRLGGRRAERVPPDFLCGFLGLANVVFGHGEDLRDELLELLERRLVVSHCPHSPLGVTRSREK